MSTTEVVAVAVLVVCLHKPSTYHYGRNRTWRGRRGGRPHSSLQRCSAISTVVLHRFSWYQCSIL